MTMSKVEEAVTCIIDNYVQTTEETEEAWAYWEAFKRDCSKELWERIRAKGKVRKRKRRAAK